jgi:hypothetical protein
MAICVQEKDRIKVSNGGSINYLKDNKKRNFNANSSKAQGKAPMQNQSQQKKFTVEKDQCLHCKKTGHYKKNYPNFLKMIMAKKCENINPCMYDIQNLLGGLTQEQLFMLLILYRDSVRRGLCKEEKDTLKSQMESKQMLKLLVTFH